MTGYLLDTNAVSTLRKQDRKHKHVNIFLASLKPEQIFVSVLTLGEIRIGIELKRKTDPLQAAVIENWLVSLGESFAGRTLSVTQEIAQVWGSFAGGRTRPIVDTLLAATAYVHGLTLMTRNVADFADLPVRLHNPWLP